MPDSSSPAADNPSPKLAESSGGGGLAVLLSEVSEGASQPFATPYAVSESEEGGSTEEDESWHDFDFDFRVHDLFEPSLRKEALTLLRQRLREHAKAHITPKRILLRDKMAFMLGTLNLLVSAYWLGASPGTFYHLYTVEVVFLLLIRWIYYRVKRWHYYLFDLCYAVQILLLLNAWAFPESIGLAKVNFAFAFGPLLWSILAFRNSLVYHSLDKITSLFLHFYPACVAWAHRFYPPQALTASLDADPARSARWDSASAWELCLLPMGPYLLWAVLYGLKIFVISSEKIKQRQYETLFGYVTTRRGLFAAVVLRFPQRLQPFAYMALHMALTLVVMCFNVVWWSNQSMALGCIIAAFLISAWNGASYYFDVFVHRYLQGLGLDPKRHGTGGGGSGSRAPTPAGPSGASAGENGAEKEQPKGTKG